MPFPRMTTRRWMLAVVLVLLAVSAAATRLTADDDPVPRDFKLVAQYARGGTARSSWKVTIIRDGTVSRTHRDAESGREIRRAYELSSGDMAELLRKIRQADFMKLKGRYEGPAEDVDGFSISLTMDEKTHEVVVWDAGGQWGDRDVRGLWKLWDEILRKVPSPNPDQKSGETPIRLP